MPGPYATRLTPVIVTLIGLTLLFANSGLMVARDSESWPGRIGGDASGCGDSLYGDQGRP